MAKLAVLLFLVAIALFVVKATTERFDSFPPYMEWLGLCVAALMAIVNWLLGGPQIRIGFVRVCHGLECHVWNDPIGFGKYGSFGLRRVSAEGVEVDWLIIRVLDNSVSHRATEIIGAIPPSQSPKKFTIVTERGKIVVVGSNPKANQALTIGLYRFEATLREGANKKGRRRQFVIKDEHPFAHWVPTEPKRRRGDSLT